MKIYITVPLNDSELGCVYIENVKAIKQIVEKEINLAKLYRGMSHSRC